VGFPHGLVVVRRNEVRPTVVRDDLDRNPVVVHLLDEWEELPARFCCGDGHGSSAQVVPNYGTSQVVQQPGATTQACCGSVSAGCLCVGIWAPASTSSAR